jgi:Tfp pilus assembly protein PilW
VFGRASGRGIMHSRSGVTLVELITAASLGSIIILALGLIVVTIQRSLSKTSEATVMQGRLRAAATTIERGLVPAGYNLDPVHDSFIAKNDTVQCAYEDKYNENGCSGNKVVVTFYAIDDTLVRISECDGSGTPVRRSVLTNVDSLGFAYYDIDGNTTATAADVAQVEFLLRLKTDKSHIGETQRETRRRVTLPNFTM